MAQRQRAQLASQPSVAASGQHLPWGQAQHVRDTMLIQPPPCHTSSCFPLVTHGQPQVAPRVTWTTIPPIHGDRPILLPRPIRSRSPTRSCTRRGSVEVGHSVSPSNVKRPQRLSVSDLPPLHGPVLTLAHLRLHSCRGQEYPLTVLSCHLCWQQQKPLDPLSEAQHVLWEQPLALSSCPLCQQQQALGCLAGAQNVLWAPWPRASLCHLPHGALLLRAGIKEPLPRRAELRGSGMGQEQGRASACHLCNPHVACCSRLGLSQLGNTCGLPSQQRRALPLKSLRPFLKELEEKQEEEELPETEAADEWDSDLETASIAVLTDNEVEAEASALSGDAWDKGHSKLFLTSEPEETSGFSGSSLSGISSEERATYQPAEHAVLHKQLCMGPEALLALMCTKGEEMEADKMDTSLFGDIFSSRGNEEKPMTSSCVFWGPSSSTPEPVSDPSSLHSACSVSEAHTAHLENYSELVFPDLSADLGSD
ncbi:hypothetical protein Nmel_001675 [Mimus melanotis]